MNELHDDDIPSEHDEGGLPYKLVRRLVLLSLVFGVLGGLAGAYGIVRYFPASIPADKRAVILQENSATINVAKKVSPSVVSITSESTGFSFFGQAQTQKGAGTGFVVSDDGLILTNNHVVEGGTTVTVFDNTGKKYSAEVVAVDPQNDIAFLRIKNSGLKPLKLANSSLVQVGTRVVAIGNALGQFQNTVTEGIISGKGRPVVAGDEGGNNLEQLQNLFQTDAAINPGNSGGPLVDLSGNVIGINTAVAGGGAQNIGFAIPINEVKKALASVMSEGKIVKPYLGVRYIPITPAFAAQNSLAAESGAYLSGDDQNPAVISGSPAAKAGLKQGDIITKIDGIAIDENTSLSSLIADHSVGETATLTVLRAGKTETIKVKLEQAPSSKS